MLTEKLTGALEKNSDVVAEYFVTDVSFALASGAASICSHPYVTPKTYDLGKPFEEQGFTSGSMDIVTAFYVLHATPDIAATLSSIYRLLTPGGCLLVIELDGDLWDKDTSPKRRAGTLWCDFVFGCFSEWHGATDGRNHCVMSPKQWQSALKTAGFCNIQLAVDPNGGLGFTFSAQKPHQIPLEPVKHADSSFFTFKYGEESRLQKHLSQLDVNRPLTVWLLASEGMDGDAAAGMTPTLARELSHWTICTAKFPKSLHKESDRIRAIMQHWEYIVNEQIVYFDYNKNAFVSKLIPLAPPPIERLPFDPNGPWVSDGIMIKQNIVSSLKDGEVLVLIHALSREHSLWRGFVGRITESCDSDMGVGVLVVGITKSAQISNYITCETNMLAEIDELDAFLAEDALSMVIGVLALGPTRLECSKSGISPMHVMFPEPTEINQSIAHFLEYLTWGFQVSFGFPSNDEQFTLIITESSIAEAQSDLKAWLVPKTGNLFVWDAFLHHASEVDPLSIGRALATALKLPTAPHSAKAAPPFDLVKTLPVTVPEPPLFRSGKAYIILGGASDFGLHMALWMYAVRAL